MIGSGRVLLGGLSILVAAPAAAELPAGAFGWMRDLAGHCWTGRHPDGTRDRQCYTTQFDRFLRGTIQITAPGETGAPAYRGDSLLAWDGAASQVRFYYWGSGGNHGVITGMVEGDGAVFGNPARPGEQDSETRNLWTRTGTDSFRVVQQRREGEGWADMMSVTYVRGPGGDSD